MRRPLVCAILCLLCVFCGFAMSFKGERAPESFDSVPMLEAHYDEADDGNLDYWDRCTVSLITITQGKPLYSWFGHSAILVETPGGQSYTFDYGTFSFSDEDFIANFAMGRMWFLCCCSYAESQIEELNRDGRSAYQVVLPLSAEQKKAVIGFLNANVQEENRTYLYHHYKDNCATRLRDIIDWTTGGDFQAWAKGIEGSSFRQQTSRALSRNRFAQWALDFLQSGQIDGEGTLWDEMFLPDVLQGAVMEYFGLESVLLVDNTASGKAVPAEPQGNMLFSVLLGLFLGGVLMLLLVFGKERLALVFRGLSDLVLGILGSALFFLMVFTNHDVTWFNENLLFVNPILLVTSVLSFVALSSRHRRLGGVVDLVHAVFFCIIAVLAILKLLFGGVFLQRNWPVIVPVCMYYLPSFLRICRRLKCFSKVN